MILDGNEIGAVDMTKSVIELVKAGEVETSELVISRPVRKWNSKKRNGLQYLQMRTDFLRLERPSKDCESDLPLVRVGYIVTKPDEVRRS